MSKDITLKIGRAEYHLEELERETAAFLASSVAMTAKKFNSEKGLYIYRYHVLKPLDELGLIAGDFIHNLRSALDHLAWKLATRNLGAGMVPERTVVVPIYNTQPKDKDWKRAVRQFSAEVQELIRQVQPYQKGVGWIHDDLWLLHDIWNCDKHRTIIAMMNLTAGSFVGAQVHSYIDEDDMIWEIPPLDPPHDKEEPRVATQVIFEWEIYDRDLAKMTEGTADFKNGKWARTTSIAGLRKMYEYVTSDILPRFSELLA
jgi:hypothetical protein